MSRGQLRTNSSICADCGAPDPTWGSINRGVLICDECCSVHRSLGRHVSQVKSLRKGAWSPTQLSMVQQLVSLGANSIWEHSLLDPAQNKQGRKKPTPRDPLHPTKEDFIRAKYQFLSFVNKQKDSESQTVNDLSKQLHSSVRTGNLETSLRLLSLGADPNYFHPEKGTSPLHVAAQVGQTAQVELLVVYGADPGAFDANGKTPVEHARSENHTDLADRIIECQYELTDRLAFYLCSKKPDHRSGQHFIIPDLADGTLDMSELAKAAKKKLQALPNHLFEELAMDVYDEVDRRENNSVWLASQGALTTENSLVTDRQTVPFLPVNPEFSSTRNQGRQKLARFNAREFATLIIDILSDARRRQLGITSPSSSTVSPSKHSVIKSASGDRSLVTASTLSDDEPLYDHVASDEDYASIGDNHSLQDQKLTNSGKQASQQSVGSSENPEGPISVEEYLDVKRSLTESTARVQQLVQTNKDLKQEINLLRNMVQKLMQENAQLQAAVGPDHTGLPSPPPLPTTATSTMADHWHNAHITSNVPSNSGTPTPSGTLSSGGSAGAGTQQVTTGSRRNVSSLRPKSMFEPRNQLRQKRTPHKMVTRDESAIGSLHSSLTRTAKGEIDAKSVSTSKLNSDVCVIGEPGDYENANHVERTGGRTSAGSARSSGHSHSSHSASSHHASSSSSRSQSSELIGAGAISISDDQLCLPSQEDVVKKTERITKKIQELLVSAQEGKVDSYSICSEKIYTAVEEMSLLFPQSLRNDQIKMVLQSLTSSSLRLREECNALQVSSQMDTQAVTQQVIQCAYNIAKAAKQLVMLFE